MVRVMGQCTGSKIEMRDEGLLIHEDILAWCIFCLGLLNRLCVNVSMAWRGMVWCGIVNMRDEALCRYENNEYRYKGL